MMKSLILLTAGLCVLNAGYIKEALSAKDDHNKLAQIYEDACNIIYGHGKEMYIRMNEINEGENK